MLVEYKVKQLAASRVAYPRRAVRDISQAKSSAPLMRGSHRFKLTAAFCPTLYSTNVGATAALPYRHGNLGLFKNLQNSQDYKRRTIFNEIFVNPRLVESTDQLNYSVLLQVKTRAQLIKDSAYLSLPALARYCCCCSLILTAFEEGRVKFNFFEKI